MTEQPSTIDQQLACGPPQPRLADASSKATFGTETIERFLTSSYDQFAARATHR